MSLNIQILIKPNKPHHEKWCGAFSEGYNGNVLETPDRGDIVQDVDLVVFWSMHWDAVIQDCRRKGIPFLCLEMGYIDRENFASVNLNGLNGRSKLQVPSDDNSRCMKHGWYQKKQKLPGDRIVIMGQLPGDKSLDGIDIYDWALKVHERYKAIDLYSEFKPHPLDKQEIAKIPIFTGDIHKDASYLVTYSSNSGVDAWVNGVSAIAHSETSMLWKWQNKIGFMNEFMNDISYRQYSLEEFRSGEAWKNLYSQILKSN